MGRLDTIGYHSNSLLCMFEDPGTIIRRVPCRQIVLKKLAKLVDKETS
jgi:hypothetical protein